MNHKDAKLVTNEIDGPGFVAGIFFSDANLLSPVAIYSDHQEFQSLQDCCKEADELPRILTSYTGPAGIGQYSLKKSPAGVISRVDVQFRLPKKDEMALDYDTFGDQVLGPAVAEVPVNEKEQYKNNGVFTAWGEDHYFLGPLRIVKVVLTSRVFKGGIPFDISDLVREIDGAAEKGDMISLQNYMILHASGGMVSGTAFLKAEDFDFEKMEFIGNLEEGNGKLVFYKKGILTDSIDLTHLLQ